MSKQMHQLDDEEDPGSSRLWHRNQSTDEPTAQAGSHLRTDPQQNSSGSDDSSEQAKQRMGKLNPFENWQVKSATNKQDPLLPPNSQTVKSVLGLIWQAISTVILAGVIAATLFSLWMPGSFMPGNLGQKVADAVAVGEEITQTEVAEGIFPVNFPTDKIGIVVGHRGHDSGAVCANGLTELEINSNVATYVQQKLIDAGYEVELLDEFDSRLKNFQAGLLLSIHSDSCDYINDSATGFKVAAAFSQKADKSSSRLVQCLSDRYANITGLRYHYQSVTTDMTEYHAFDEIDPYTTAGIIELGFMNLDQEILTTQPELLADGVVSGIKCYMNNEEVQQP